MLKYVSRNWAFNDNELSYYSLYTVINGAVNVLDRAREALNKAVAMLIESQRENFATGWPELGIEPIDPFFLEYHKLEPEEFTGFSS